MVTVDGGRAGLFVGLVRLYQSLERHFTLIDSLHPCTALCSALESSVYDHEADP